MIDTYNRLRDEAQGAVLLTPSQQVWVRNMRSILVLSPMRALAPPPADAIGTLRPLPGFLRPLHASLRGMVVAWARLRLACFRITSHNAFEPTVMALVACNLVSIFL